MVACATGRPRRGATHADKRRRRAVPDTQGGLHGSLCRREEAQQNDAAEGRNRTEGARQPWPGPGRLEGKEPQEGRPTNPLQSQQGGGRVEGEEPRQGRIRDARESQPGVSATPRPQGRLHAETNQPSLVSVSSNRFSSGL